MPATTQLFNELIEARDEKAWRVRYEWDGGRDWVLAFGETKDKVRERCSALFDEAEIVGVARIK